MPIEEGNGKLSRPSRSRAIARLSGSSMFLYCLGVNKNRAHCCRSCSSHSLVSFLPPTSTFTQGEQQRVVIGALLERPFTHQFLARSFVFLFCTGVPGFQCAQHSGRRCPLECVRRTDRASCSGIFMFSAEASTSSLCGCDVEYFFALFMFNFCAWDTPSAHGNKQNVLE